LPVCKECGIDYETGVKDCCSMDCHKKDVQKRINEATENEASHTKELS